MKFVRNTTFSVRNEDIFSGETVEVALASGQVAE